MQVAASKSCSFIFPKFQIDGFWNPSGCKEEYIQRNYESFVFGLEQREVWRWHFWQTGITDLNVGIVQLDIN